MSEPQFASAGAGDLERISAFIRSENRETRTTAAYLEWWYFRNPSRVHSLVLLQRQADVMAVASANSLKVRVGGEDRLAGLPQKVLTAKPLRGLGYFGQLYWKTEEESLARGVDLFLTFTNAASTPIFLGKFSYVRGICPDLVVLPAQLLRLLSRSRYRLVERIPGSFFDRPVYSPPNSVAKTWEYLEWRYMSFEAAQYEILEIARTPGSVAGYAVLKKIKKKGLPLHLLMDVVAHEKGDLPFLVEQAALYSTRRGALALLYLDFAEIEDVSRRHLHRRVPGRFNFLVKGKDAAATQDLAKTTFAFSFGDFDFT